MNESINPFEIYTPEDTATPIEDEGLDQVVDVIEVYNISDTELRDFFSYQSRITTVIEILEDSIVEDFIQERSQYEQELTEQLGEDVLNLSALFYLLPGKPIDSHIAKNIKTFDVPDGLIQSFLDERLERLEREAGIIE